MNKRVRPQYQGAEKITALVYLCAMSAALMYVLCREQAVVCTVIMTAVSFGVYMVFRAFRKRRALAAAAFFALALVGFVVLGVVMNGDMRADFVDFIFRNSEYFSAFFAAAVIFLFSCIFGFTVCYFSVYLPRPSFLLLPALIPMILSARTSGGLPAGITVFLALGFGLAVLGSAQPEMPDGVTYFDDGKSRAERLASVGIFAAAAAVILAVAPRDTNTPMGSYLDSVFNSRNSFYGQGTLSDFVSSSGVNRGANNPSDNILFYVTTHYPTYLSRWSFDEYNGEDGWTTLSEYTTGWDGWETAKQSLDINALALSLKQGALDGRLDEYADKLVGLDVKTTESVSMSINIADGSSTRVVIHPNNTTDVFIFYGRDVVYRTRKDEMFTENDFGVNASYFLYYYVGEINESMISLLEGEDFAELLNRAAEEGVISEIVRDSFLNEYNFAESYYEKTAAEEIDPRITSLAEEITAGLTSDYEKALAIERWFGEAEFVYDLDFVPEEATAEYFLFESRRGICSDFASAATLLLRAAGISARYTEGFLLSDDNLDEYGRYAVRAADAHAYATCYIKGLGWLEVDGTKYAAVVENTERPLYAAAAALIIICAAAVLAVVFRKQLSEAVFAVSLLFRSKSGKIRAIYLRTRKTVCAISGADPETTAAEEVASAAGRSLGLYDEAKEITGSADMLLYGGEVPEISVKRLYSDYKLIRKVKRDKRK